MGDVKFKVGDKGKTAGGWDYTVVRADSEIMIEVEHVGDCPLRHYVMFHDMHGGAGPGGASHQLMPPTSSAVVSPTLRQNPSLGCWECEGPAFTGNPSWDGIRRHESAEAALDDWRATYDAYAAIYRVKGLTIPVARPDTRVFTFVRMP